MNEEAVVATSGVTAVADAALLCAKGEAVVVRAPVVSSTLKSSFASVEAHRKR
jgi:hypothetical protein